MRAKLNLSVKFIISHSYSIETFIVVVNCYVSSSVFCFSAFFLALLVSIEDLNA